MLDVLSDRRYRSLFLAQVLALLGTGLATVALGLLAFDLAPERASMVLGTVLTIKMVAYVVLAPLASALIEGAPRRSVLITLDIIRALAALCLPFVDALWQVYLVIFFLQAASAGFTPTFQATIPDILQDEARYTKALSLSRLAYDLESLISPTLAAVLLLILPASALFGGTALGFAASALLVASLSLPRPAKTGETRFRERLTKGIRIFVCTPRLRGLLAMNMAVSAGGAMVIVNTVSLVQGDLARGEGAVALALSAFGLGSMAAALGLPRLLARRPDRQVMSLGAACLGMGLLGLWLADRAFGSSMGSVLGAWVVLGVGFSTVQTPSGRLLRRSAQPQDRPALFAAQFALSHSCWLIAYPLSGWLMTRAGTATTLPVLAAIVIVSLWLARRLWPANDPEVKAHSHPELPADHPHLRNAQDGRTHAHAYTIDDLHRHWPRAG